jgi:hypothetical protein
MGKNKWLVLVFCKLMLPQFPEVEIVKGSVFCSDRAFSEPYLYIWWLVLPNGDRCPARLIFEISMREFS